MARPRVVLEGHSEGKKAEIYEERARNMVQQQNIDSSMINIEL